MAIPSHIADGLRQVVEPIETALTLPPGAYCDQSTYEHEELMIFRRGWVSVGRVDRWADPGSYVAMAVGGVPIVVVRDEHKTLRCFANTCSHRANQIMSGEGKCSHMRCGFHFWTYRLDGALHGAPSMQRTPDFDRDAHALTEFSLAERFGFVFVSFEPDPPDIDLWLGDFGDLHLRWSLEHLRTARRREFRVNCNWKSFTEVFNEYYHLPYVHPDSIADQYHEPKDPDVVKGAFATQFGSTTGTGGLLDGAQNSAFPPLEGLEGEWLGGTRYTWLFPNLTFAAGSEAIWIYEIYPEAPGRTLCAQTVCFPQSTIDLPDFEERSAEYYKRFDVALAEDIPVLERQFVGQQSPYGRQGRFSHLEPSVANFACWYAQRMTESR